MQNGSKDIGDFHISGLQKVPEGATNSSVTIHVALDLHGLVKCTQAVQQWTEEFDEPTPEATAGAPRVCFNNRPLTLTFREQYTQYIFSRSTYMVHHLLPEVNIDDHSRQVVKDGGPFNVTCTQLPWFNVT